MEDGSPNYISIISLDTFLNSKVNSDYIHELTFNFYDKIRNLKYSNGTNLFILYDINLKYTYLEFCKYHGSIITFNLQDKNSNYIGYNNFENLCILNNISIRTGSLCNKGACYKNLNIDDNNLPSEFSCIGNIDIINNIPTGAIRVSFSQYNTMTEIYKFLDLIKTKYIN